MTEAPELIEAPLSKEELGAPGNYHGAMRLTLGTRLAALGGRCFVEASVVTDTGLFVTDVAWASVDFMRVHGFETRAAYLATGADEIHNKQGILSTSRYPVDLAGIFE